MNGHQLISKLEQELGSSPHLYMTGYVDDQIATNFQIPREYVLFKPFKPSELKQRVTSALQGMHQPFPTEDLNDLVQEATESDLN